jgi:hypothetical protein
VPITNSSRVFATAYDVSLESFRRKSYWEPEEKLMLAVLDDAIACFQKYAFARDRKGKVLFQEAEEWVQAINHDWPFSFVNVCEILGFATDYLRHDLASGKPRSWRAGQKPRSISSSQRTGRKREASPLAA